MEPARVDVELKFFPLMWILYLVKPWLSVNGMAERRTWDTHSLSLAPGRYQFEAWFPYMFSSQTCKGSVVVDLAPGGSYKLKYRPAWLVFLPGKLTVVSSPALPQATARQLPGN
ncbi:MAG TPA: hypothetical protein VFQ53_35420 [Kofleriaceae bacterium]|nr:hypothetical protein [Kofleriaceae bacterium]